MNDAAPWVFLGRDPLTGRWGGRQHLASAMAARSPVVYVEDPVRSPFGAGSGPAAGGGGLVRLVPWEMPLQRFEGMRRAAVASTASAVRRALPAGGGAPTVVFYARTPLALVDALGPARAVYHAIDDWSERWDGTVDEEFLAWERTALDRADLTVAITTPLAARLRSGARGPVEVIPLGWDEAAFRPPLPPPPPGIADLPRPLLGFVGTVRPDRFDMPILEHLSRAFPGGTLLFAGREFDDGGGGMARLRALPNARLLGPRPRSEVAALVGALDAAVAPYGDGRLNRSCWPLKVLDALAAGRPAVSSPERPDLVEIAGAVGWASDPASFEAAVRRALAEGKGPAAEERRRRAVRDLTWTRIAERFRTLAGTTPNSIIH